MSFEQQDLEKLSEELRDFTKGLENFTNTFKDGKMASGQSSDSNSAKKKKLEVDFDKSTQKMVNALALLTASLTKSSTSAAQEARAVEKFNKSVEKVTNAQEKSAIAQARSQRAAELLEERSKARVESAKKSNANFESSVGDFAKKLSANGKKMLRGSDDVLKSNSDVFNRTASLASTGIKEVTRFSSSLTSGGDSFNSLNSVIGLLGKSVGGLLGIIPFVGQGLSKLSEAGAEVAKTMVDQFATNLKSYKALADTGLVSSFEDMQETGKATSLLYQDINQSLGKYTTNIAQFGGSMSNGMKIFNSVAKEMQPLREEFRALGIGAAEFAEYQAKYLAQEGRLGLVKDMDSKKLSQGTKKYIEELDIMAKLTGESRQGIQAKQEAARAETQYAATRELYKNDKQVMQELDNLMILLENVSPEMAKGVRANIGGVPIGEEGAKAFLQTGGAVAEVLQQVLNKQLTGVEARNRIFGAVNKTMGDEGTAKVMATAGDIGGPYSGYANIQKMINAGVITQKDLAEAIRIQEETKAKAGDGKTLTGAGAKAEEAVYDASRKMQELFMSPKGLNAVVGSATSALEKFVTAIEEAINFFDGDNKTSSGATVAPGQFSSNQGGAAFGNPMISRGAAGKRVSSEDKKKFFDDMYNAVLSSAKTAGVANPEAIAKLGASQSALETGWGKSLAGGNNYFGIKGGNNKQKTQEFIDGKMVTVEDNFRGYKSLEESANDYVNFLVKNPRYEEVLAAKTAEAAISAQGTTGYATDPDYANKLKSIHDTVKPATPGARTGGIFRGPSTGYNVELHGDEMVVPANEGVSKQALNTSIFNQDQSAMGDLVTLFERMSDKYDLMIDLLSRSTDNSDKLVMATV